MVKSYEKLNDDNRRGATITDRKNINLLRDCSLTAELHEAFSPDEGDYLACFGTG